MLFDQMAELIGRAPIAALDDVTRALWAAVSAAQLNDDDALRLSQAIDARRLHSKAVQAAAGGSLRPARLPPPRKHQRPPERSVAIERRRRLAASGPMPPALAARFSTGELAVLRIVADEFRARQVCALCLDAIAAKAGVSRTTAQNAIRQARRLGMVEVEERRRAGMRSLPNLVRIIDREWLAWIRHHGFKKLSTTDKEVFEKEGRPTVRYQVVKGRTALRRTKSDPYSPFQRMGRW
jgi:biotin operon repressor